MKINTLKIQLVKKLILPITVLLMIIGGLVFWSAQEEISEVYDSQLITAANVLWVMSRGAVENNTEVTIEAKSPDINELDQSALDDYAKWRAFRIWKNNKLIMASDNASPEKRRPAKRGFSNIMRKSGGEWRVFALYIPEEDIIVEVSENLESRHDIIGNILVGVLWPLLCALPVFAFLIWRGLNKGLQDLRRFAGDIEKRTPNDLSHLNETNVFEELLPISKGINQLLFKLEKSLSYERLFTDNATHELRTPLAALQIQTEVILHSQDEIERKNALQELAKSSRRTSRLLDQLLILTQLRDNPGDLKSVNLYSITSEVIKEAYGSAVKKDINISLSGNETLEVMSHYELLFTMVHNVIDNAIKYTPLGGEVNISIDGDKQEIIITDTGPGIPTSEYENVFHRFYRLSGNSQTGSGLGLAIVRQISEILNIEIIFFAPKNKQGLGIRLIFSNH